jgi:hypothetical protein
MDAAAAAREPMPNARRLTPSCWFRPTDLVMRPPRPIYSRPA